MKLITTLTFISLLIMYIAISVLIVIELFKIYRLTKRNTVVTLGRLIKPIEEPFTNIKSQNQIIKEAIIELDKKATLEHKQQAQANYLSEIKTLTLGGKYE